MFTQILLGSIALSLVHAIIPNHWLPLVAIGRTERWETKETLGVTAITGSAHTLSTILIGIIIGVLGYRLSESYSFITHIIAPAVLILLGVVYLVLDYKEKMEHKLHHHIDEKEILKKKGKNKKAIIASLAFAMFFSPCIEIEAYYLTASKIGWTGIVTVSLVYFFVTVIGMMILVYYGSKGIAKFKFHFMEHHEKLISGLVLIVLGIITFFID